MSTVTQTHFVSHYALCPAYAQITLFEYSLLKEYFILKF